MLLMHYFVIWQKKIEQGKKRENFSREYYRFYYRLDTENDLPSFPFPICIVPNGKFLYRLY